MCPLCIGSALLAVSGAGSAGGLALIAARVLGAGGPRHARSLGHRHGRWPLYGRSPGSADRGKDNHGDGDPLKG